MWDRTTSRGSTSATAGAGMSPLAESAASSAAKSVGVDKRIAFSEWDCRYHEIPAAPITTNSASIATIAIVADAPLSDWSPLSLLVALALLLLLLLFLDGVN